MKQIYALTDYKGHFGSKWNAQPYRSGFDKKLLQQYMNKYGYEFSFLSFSEVDFLNDNWKEQVVIYTSSEERGLKYKDFIEDVILGLEQSGAHVLPPYAFLRANNNKVYMEILRKQLMGNDNKIDGKIYGTYEELKKDVDKVIHSFPCVIKEAEGAMSRGVFLAHSEKELLKKAWKVSRNQHFLAELKEKVRVRKHKGYKPESKNQNKFIVQPFIPNLSNDWKILIYGDHYFLLKRGIKGGDFRASGSGYDYKAGSESEFPVFLLDQIEAIYSRMNVPQLSIDFAYDGQTGYMFEFQAVYFGPATHEFSSDYYTKRNGQWITEKKQFDQEEEYAYGLVKFLEKNPEYL